MSSERSEDPKGPTSEPVRIIIGNLQVETELPRSEPRQSVVAYVILMMQESYVDMSSMRAESVLA